MSSFDRFRQRNLDYLKAKDNVNSRFVFAGYPSVELKCGDNSQIAAVVNQHEKKSAYIFTKVDEPLNIGNIYTAKNLHLLVSEEVTIIKDVNWRKYIAIPCNVEIDGTWGYFKGPEESYINITLKQSVMIESQQKPILVLPQDTLNFEDKVVIGNRGWIVQEYDSISTPGITYYSLRPSAVTDKEEEIIRHNDETIVINEEYDDDTNHYVYPTTCNEIATEEGYFKSSTDKIIIKARTSNKVMFILPFGVNEAEIKVKENGEEVIHTYRHVE